MHEIKEIATDLRFPEGPIAMPDGSILLVEIAAGTLTQITSEGKKETVATLGGGPNGAAIGPDGKCYVCNNGGFEWHSSSKGLLFPGMKSLFSHKFDHFVFAYFFTLSRECPLDPGRSISLV